jgi:hypothetical protein
MGVMPDVPTFAETVPGYEVMFWGGLLAPAARRSRSSSA